MTVATVTKTYYAITWRRRPERVELMINGHWIGRVMRGQDGWIGVTERGDYLTGGSTQGQAVQWLQEMGRAAVAINEIPRHRWTCGRCGFVFWSGSDAVRCLLPDCRGPVLETPLDHSEVVEL
jgi:hypothetical protein